MIYAGGAEREMRHVEMDCFVFARVSRATQKLGTIRAFVRELTAVAGATEGPTPRH